MTAKLADAAYALPLVAVYALGAYGLVPLLAGELAALAKGLRAMTTLQVVSQCATLAFMALQLVLFAVPRLPEHKAAGWLPRAVAIIGSNLDFALLLLPRVEQSLPMLAVSTSVATLGLFGSLYSAATLGRSFSVVPQARGAVYGGPYRWVRHPLYLSEQITTFGIMWQFGQPWASLIAVASLAMQILRMHFE